MQVRTIAVIGAGAVGREIAYAAASGGYTTILEDVSRATLDGATAWMMRRFDTAVSRGELEANARDAAVRSLTTASTIEEAFAQADLIIETVADEMEMKIELVTLFDKFARPEAIFASTASGSIAEMAEGTYRRERCIGMHFCDTVADGRALELVRGSETSQETVDLCSDVGRQMGMRPRVVRESERNGALPAERKAASAQN